jgi:hypothetical protein
MARKQCFRFGLREVFTGRLHIAGSALAFCQFGWLRSSPDRRVRQIAIFCDTCCQMQHVVRFKKPATGFPGRANILAMMNICR